MEEKELEAKFILYASIDHLTKTIDKVTYAIYTDTPKKEDKKTVIQCIEDAISEIGAAEEMLIQAKEYAEKESCNIE